MLRDLTDGALTLRFTEGRKLTGKRQEHILTFTKKPLGFTPKKSFWGSQVEVAAIERSSPAEDLGVKKGWVLASVNNVDVGHMPYMQAIKFLDEEVERMVTSSPARSPMEGVGSEQRVREVTFAGLDPLPSPPAKERSSYGGGGYSGRRGLPEAVSTILQEVGASQDMLRFWLEWDNRVFRQALTSSRLAIVIVSSDVTSLEVQLTGPASLFVKLLKDFVTQLEIPPFQMKEIVSANEELMATTASLWCRFRNLGGERSRPSLDAGIILRSSDPLAWKDADLLMPDVSDEDTLREFAMQDQALEPTEYSSSIFPVEPEKGLGFELAQDMRSFLSSFLIFKAMGFVKPKDETIKLLTLSLPKRISFSVYMGPLGLTRVKLRLGDMSKFLGFEISETLRCRYQDEMVDQVGATLGVEASILEYVADSRGYTMNVGFQM